MITKEAVEKIMKTEGQVKGAVLQTDASYVKKIWGEEGLNKVKEELKKLGHPIEYEKAKALEWFPIGLRVLSLLVIKDIFDLSEEDIKTMGNIVPKLSFIVKIMMKFFVSPKMTVEHGPELWSRHYSTGKLEVEHKEKEKFLTVTLKDVKLDPVICKYLEGYFQRIMQFTVGENVKCQEIKCMFKGDPCHVYRVSWK